MQIKILTSGGIHSSRHSAPLRAAFRAVFSWSNPFSRRVLLISRFYVQRTPQTCRKCFYCQTNDVWRNNFRCVGSFEHRILKTAKRGARMGLTRKRRRERRREAARSGASFVDLINHGVPVGDHLQPFLHLFVSKNNTLAHHFGWNRASK